MARWWMRKAALMAEPLPILEYATPASPNPRASLFSPAARGFGLVFGALLPFGNLLLMMTGLSTPHWQSGRFCDYARLFLCVNSAWPFLPLLGYSMWCMATVCYTPINVRRFWIRLGVYSGVLLSFEYGIIMLIIMGEERIGWFSAGACLSTLAAGGAMALVLGFGRLILRLGAPFWVVSMLIGLLAIAATGENGILLTAGVFLIGGTVFSPALALGAYLAMSLLAWKSSRDLITLPPSQVAPVSAWAGIHVFSWVIAVELAMRNYQKLPVSPPSGCYIATAAARGHRRFVRAEAVALSSGGTALVNDQLRRLKCAEIALAALSPGFHRMIRAFYDRVGPPLASALACPLLADIAYVLLKPAEWLSAAALRRLIPRFDEMCSSVYSRMTTDN